MSERLNGMFRELLDRALLRNITDTILMIKEGKMYPLPPNIEPLPGLLGEVDFSGKEKIEILSDLVVAQLYSGEPESRYRHGPIYKGEGVLLGKQALSWEETVAPVSTHDPYNSEDCGFKLWLLSDGKLALHFFYQQTYTSGKLSGPGYTGSEETEIIYGAPFRRVATINKGGVNLESEVKDVIEVEDVKRVEYSLPIEGDIEFHILDLDEKGEWANSSRHSYGSHVWRPCSMDSKAVEVLRSEFGPTAERLGVDLNFNARKLVEAAAERYLGSYREKLERQPYPGEIQRGETPSIRIDVYQKPEGTTIFLKEKPIV